MKYFPSKATKNSKNAPGQLRFNYPFYPFITFDTYPLRANAHGALAHCLAR